MKEYKVIPNSLHYGISKCGEVVRLPHERFHNINKTTYYSKLKILKPSTNNSKGYERINIKYLDNTKKVEAVHRLVATVWVPNPYNKLQVNHIDGNKLNNSYLNLEWVTNEENAQHAATLIRTTFNKRYRKSKLSELDVINIATKIKEESNLSIKILAKEYGVSPTTITELKSGRSWRHLNLFEPKARKCEKYFKYRSRYVPTTEETQASIVELINH